MDLCRLELLIGDKINLIKNKTVLIIGIGGVGGYALEAITRSGVNNIIIVDGDTISSSNINRQIICNQNNIGKNKVDEAKKRILSINPNCNIKTSNLFLDDVNVHELFNEHIDYIMDCCDTIKVKKELIRIAVNNNIKIISSMGTGRKLNPLKLTITDIRKTSYDPIAKILRKMIKDEKINKKIPVVTSTEQSIKTNSKTIGSTSFLPGVAGLMMASYVINDMIGEKIC